MGRFSKWSALVATFATSVGAMECPGSGSLIHAGIKVTAKASAECAKVKAEIQARVNGDQGWKDPHNAGNLQACAQGVISSSHAHEYRDCKQFPAPILVIEFCQIAEPRDSSSLIGAIREGVYTLLSQTDSQIRTQRTTNPAKSVGGKVYTDKQIFTFADGDDGTCQIQACSESQGFSIKDFSTNYCDIHNLYCNDETCNPIISSFDTTETEVKPNLGSGGKDPSKCRPSSLHSSMPASSASMECPGSGSFIHAGIKVTATSQATCSIVKSEIKARIAGEKGWKDPHNAGNYSLLSETETQIKTQRSTNPKTSVGGKVYTDKQIFTFADKSDKTCQIYACSESQGTSVMDFSTNYCDIHNLYCNDAVCHPIDSFVTTEDEVSPRFGSGGKNPSKCVPSVSAIVV